MHLINKNLALALSLQGRIKIEERDYDAASESFRKAISLDAGNPLLLLWDAYANYLKIEFSSGLKDEKYQERIASITRSLERADKLSKKHGETRAYILYFLVIFTIRVRIFLQRSKDSRNVLKNVWH
jgi:tetratricopeptide (TPR) repeat protein